MKEEYINKIYELALESFNFDEIPVGAIVVMDNQILGVGVNSRHRNKDVIGHAEINAIKEACSNIGDWRLDGCELYVTLLPCLMCTGAILESRIRKVYYLCERTNVRINIKDYVEVEKIDSKEFEEKYLNLLQLFFENKRN